jgi:hypothetical protein
VIHRLWLLPIAATFALVVAPSTQPPIESAVGRTYVEADVPAVVRMTGERVLDLLVRAGGTRFMLTRSDIRIECRVARHVDNRRLTLSWSSDSGTVGASQRWLEGEDAPVLHVWNLPSQPPANYMFVATVIDRTGKRRAREEARIERPEDRE